MCYNIAYMEKRAQRYHERYSHLLPPDWSEQYRGDDEMPTAYFMSGFVHPVLPIIKQDGIGMYEWGLIPHWCKDEKQASDMQRLTLNAIGETAFEKPSYRNSLPKKRCVLGVSGFYEWRDINKVKYPYFIKLKEEDIFSLGCIYETWNDKATGEIRNTFSIITTPANPLMEKIHNVKKRMPLILDRESEKRWINPELSKDEIRELMVPFDENKMTAYTVSRDVNSAKNNRNTPESIVPVQYAALAE